MGSFVQVTLDATIMFASNLNLFSVFFFMISVCTISSSSSSTQETCENLIDGFEDLTSEEKLDFFEEDDLVRKYKFCLTYIGMKDSIEFDEDNSDFGIQNEVDNLVPISSFLWMPPIFVWKATFQG